MRYISVVTILIFLFSCGKKDDPPGNPSGKLRIKFAHQIDGTPLVFDDLKYTNEAGNAYLVNEIQYFLSDVKLLAADGTVFSLNNWDDIHYVDTDIISSQEKLFPDEIPIGNYKALVFTFGLDEEKNQSLLFLNPPESLMFWPELLGGGYHYMKLNGKWLDTLDQVSPFNFHLGIGQIYEQYPDLIEAYVHNHFIVQIDNIDLEIAANATAEITLIMHVENWFRSPNIYDHNFWGGDIMQNQEAMQAACENGWDVFSIGQ